MPGVTMETPRGKTELVPRWKCDAGDYVAAAEISKDARFCVVGACSSACSTSTTHTARSVVATLRSSPPSKIRQ